MYFVDSDLFGKLVKSVVDMHSTKSFDLYKHMSLDRQTCVVRLMTGFRGNSDIHMHKVVHYNIVR